MVSTVVLFIWDMSDDDVNIPLDLYAVIITIDLITTTLLIAMSWSQCVSSERRGTKSGRSSSRGTYIGSYDPAFRPGQCRMESSTGRETRNP